MRLAVLAFVALFSPTVQGPDTDAAGRLEELRNRLLDQQAALAEWALGKDLFREAGYLVREVLKDRPKHASKGLVKRLQEMKPEQFRRRYRNAIKKHGPTFRRRLAQVVKPVAKDLVKLAREAQKGGQPHVTEAAYFLAYRIDRRNKDAERALRKLDFELIFNYGALPKVEKEQARATLKALGGALLREKDLKTELKQWSDAWGLRTRHYRFITNAPHAIVFRFARACEGFHAAWEDLLRRTKIPLRELRKPATVYLFDSPLTYQAILLMFGEEPLEDGLGYYSPTKEIGFFYDNPDFYGGDLTKLLETFYHEASHQLFDLRVKSPRRGDIAKFPLRWVEEGFCLYMELLAFHEEKGKRLFTIGQAIDDDLDGAIYWYEAGKFLPWEQFVHMGEKEWDDYDHAYAQASLLTHYLMEGSGKRFRKHAFELLEKHMTQSGLRKKNFFDYLGLDAARLDKEIRQHVAAIKKSLKLREYGGK